MSVISNRHTVNKFVAGKSAPLSDQRLAKVGYKTTTKNPAKFPSVCVSVPVIDTANDPFVSLRADGRFDSIIRVALENAQDGIVRSLYESSGGTLTAVSDDDIGIAQCLAFIEAENAGGRLTKEFLSAWFDASMKENLFVVVADKLGFSDLTPDNEIVINKHVGVYKELICSLAGGKTVLADKQIRGLQNALELVTVDDDTCTKLKNRLNEMSKKDKMEDLLELS